METSKGTTQIEELNELLKKKGINSKDRQEIIHSVLTMVAKAFSYGFNR